MRVLLGAELACVGDGWTFRTETISVLLQELRISLSSKITSLRPIEFRNKKQSHCRNSTKICIYIYIYIYIYLFRKRQIVCKFRVRTPINILSAGKFTKYLFCFCRHISHSDSMSGYVRRILSESKRI